MSEEDPVQMLGGAETLALALGMAMGEWGKVEAEIFILYLGLCAEDAAPPNPASIVYESMVHLDTKMNAVSNLVRFKFGDDNLVYPAWTSLETRIRKRIKKVRNKLAHWRIWKHSTKPDLYFLGPQLTNPSTQLAPAFEASHGGALFADDIFEYVTTFGDLGDEIRAFTVTHVRPSLRGIDRA